VQHLLNHRWDISPAEAIRIQNELRKMVLLSDSFNTIHTVAGIDVGFDRASNTGRAAIVVLDLHDLGIIDSTFAELPLKFPYIPGLLSFREMPVILQAFTQLTILPDLLLCDGQGVAHPRRLGIACHLGLLTDIPAIGVAKTRLTGTHDTVPARKGYWTELKDKEEIIGAVLRSREKVKPIYISPGHRISLESAIYYVMKTITRYKLPETTRAAHALSLFNNTGK